MLWYKYQVKQARTSAKLLPCLCEFQALFKTSGDQQVKGDFTPLLQFWNLKGLWILSRRCLWTQEKGVF